MVLKILFKIAKTIIKWQVMTLCTLYFVFIDYETP